VLRTALPPPFLAAPRQRDGGWFYLHRRKGAAGAGVLHTAPASPFFWLRRVSETAACFYMRRRTGAAGACFAHHITASPLFVAPRQLDGGLFLHV